MDGMEIGEEVAEVMRILGSFDINNHVPILRQFDLQGMRRRARAVKGPLDKFFEKIIAEQEKLREEGKELKNFLDVLLDYMNDKDAELELDRTNIKALILVSID